MYPPYHLVQSKPPGDDRRHGCHVRHMRIFEGVSGNQAAFQNMRLHISLSMSQNASVLSPTRA